MDNKVTSRKEFIENNFNTSSDEFDKRLMFPNLDLWMSTNMSYIQLMKLLKSDPILKDENIFKKHYIAYIQLLGFYDRKRNIQLSVERAQSFIHDYLKEQLTDDEYQCIMYSIEELLANDLRFCGGQLMHNKLDSMFDSDGMSMSGISFTINNDPFVLYLLDKFTDEFRHVMNIVSGKIFILEDELLYSAIVSNTMTQKQLYFMMDFVIGHERAHITAGKTMNPHQYIAENWKGGYTVYGKCGIQEQMADREGFIYAIKQMRKRRKEYIANLY